MSPASTERWSEDESWFFGGNKLDCFLMRNNSQQSMGQMCPEERVKARSDCSIFGVKVEEVSGNVLMTFCRCDGSVAMWMRCGWGHLVGKWLGQFLLQSTGTVWEWWRCKWWREGGRVKVCVSVSIVWVTALRHNWCVKRDISSCTTKCARPTSWTHKHTHVCTN